MTLIHDIIVASIIGTIILRILIIRATIKTYNDRILILSKVEKIIDSLSDNEVDQYINDVYQVSVDKHVTAILFFKNPFKLYDKKIQKLLEN